MAQGNSRTQCKILYTLIIIFVHGGKRDHPDSTVVFFGLIARC